MSRQGNSRYQPLLSSITGAIGQTPLLELQRLTKTCEGRILAKLEYLNPGFSKKDRIALQIMDDAEKAGELSPGQTVVELTSGNTGTGLAIVCTTRGYPFVAVMSKGNSMERAQMMSALGAEVILVDQDPSSIPGEVSGSDLELVEIKTAEITHKRKAFRANQFTNRSAFMAHYQQTGPEILEQSHGKITAFCDFVGTGGTFAGCLKAFKEFNPQILGFLVEPEGAAILHGDPVTKANHRIQGGGYIRPNLPLLEGCLADGYIQVSDNEAIQAARRLAPEEGVFGGFSSGANVAAALQLLRGPCRGGTVAICICDSGLKYLSTDLWPKR